MSQTQANNQVGGCHYQGKAIDPATYNEEQWPGWWAGNVVKYITRHQDKDGIKDMKKALHYIQMILEKYYGKKMYYTLEEKPDSLDFDPAKLERL